MRVVNLVVVLVATVAYAWTFAHEGGLGGALFFFPFTMFPFVVAGILAWRWRTTAGLALLLAASLGYLAWFAFVFVDVTQVHPDPQGAIAFLFVGIYALPALALLWAFGAILEWRGRSNGYIGIHDDAR
jgi:hypothetical protein